LCQALLLPQSTYTQTEGLLKRWFHPWECPNLCLIHIHTNSHIQLNRQMFATTTERSPCAF
jgi:hypothetical protein